MVKTVDPEAKRLGPIEPRPIWSGQPRTFPQMRAQLPSFVRLGCLEQVTSTSTWKGAFVKHLLGCVGSEWTHGSPIAFTKFSTIVVR
eukprot:SAG31_NODE_851_length_11519_cov_4.727145_6_plen_87_part_00